jgi:hypothetical protein
MTHRILANDSNSVAEDNAAATGNVLDNDKGMLIQI